MGDSDSNPFRYCGEYFDKETKTYYLRARYYDPAIGRFTQQDTHWSPANSIYGDNPRKINERQDTLGLTTYAYAPEITAIMQSGNLYVYCVNNPVQYADPSGFWTIAFGIDVAIAFGFGITVMPVQIAIDDDGNVGFFVCGSWQAGTPNLAAAGVWSISNGDTIYDISGQCYAAGGSIGEGLSGGVEFSYATSELSGKNVVTVNISLGVGAIPAELHANFYGGSLLVYSTKMPTLYYSVYKYLKSQLQQMPPTIQDMIRETIGPLE